MIAKSQTMRPVTPQTKFSTHGRKLDVATARHPERAAQGGTVRRVEAITLLIVVVVAIAGCGGSSPAAPPLMPGGISINSIAPTSAPAGSPDLMLIVTGTHFSFVNKFNRSRVTWSLNGTDHDLATTFNNSSQLTATIPADLLSGPVTAQVLVVTGDIMGDVPLVRSNSLDFIVTPPAAHSGFTAAGNMLAARSGHSATALADGRVLIAGGDGSGMTAEIYDSDAGTFTFTGSMNHPREGHCAVLLADGRVLITGGDDYVNVIATAEIYDPSTGSFTPIADMTSARWAHTATLLPKGKVLIAGGADTHDSKASAEIFDPATNSFTVIESMTSARLHHTASLLPNGKVLLAGGWSSYDPITPLASAETFDPFTNTFTAAAALTSARAMHTATALSDGSIAILAGTNSHYVSISSDDVYAAGSGIFTSTGACSRIGSCTPPRFFPTEKYLSRLASAASTTTMASPISSCSRARRSSIPPQGRPHSRAVCGRNVSATLRLS